MPTNLYCNVPPFGEMIAHIDATGIVEWTPKNFPDLPLEYSVVGNQSRPVCQSAETILEIVSQPGLVHDAVMQFLNKSTYGFVKWMLDLSVEGLVFDDTENSSRFVATCIAEFGEHSAEVPPISGGGNGCWFLEFRMNHFAAENLILSDGETHQ